MPPANAVQIAHNHLHAHLFNAGNPSVAPPVLLPTVTRVTDLLRASFTTPDAPALSLLLVAPPSAGKSLVLSLALTRLSATHALNPVVLTLHGLLHTSPPAAWAALAAQLDPARQHASPVLAIRRALDRHRAARTPLLFVLDAFDRFSAAADPAAQTVLYALLNYLQDRALCAACVAMTAHIDAPDALEKRVKSRFAPREIIVPLPRHARDVCDFLKLAVDYESDADADDDDDDDDDDGGGGGGGGGGDGGGVGDASGEWAARAPLDSQEMRGWLDLYRDVARSISGAPRFAAAVEKQLCRTRVIVPLLRALDVALATAFRAELCREMDHGARKQRVDRAIGARTVAALTAFEEHLFPPDPLRAAMLNLSAVELSLLVALRRIHRTGDAATFATVFRQYATLRSGGIGLVADERDGEATVPRGVAEKSWEQLVEAGLVARVGHGPRHMRRVVLGVDAADVDSVLKNHRYASTTLKAWAKASG